jgi:hypothetical protein
VGGLTNYSDIRADIDALAAELSECEELKQVLLIGATGLDWLAIRGALLLAARHPEIGKPLKVVLDKFCDSLMYNLVHAGAITAAQAAQLRKHDLQGEAVQHGRKRKSERHNNDDGGGGCDSH